MENEQFDALAYFQQLAKSNKLTNSESFVPCFCSGPESIQGVMDEWRKASNFVMIDDTTDANTISNKIGWFTKNVYTVFILAGYKMDDMQDRQNKLNLCRRIFRQFMSRMIKDKDEYTYGEALEYLNLDNVYSKQLGRYSMNGVTGLYFMIGNDEPTDLQYEESEWE